MMSFFAGATIRRIMPACIFCVCLCLFFPAVSDASDASFEERIAMELQELVSQFEAPPTTEALNQPIDFSKIIEQNAKGAVLDNFKETINKLDPRYAKNIKLPSEATGFIAQASADWMVTRALLYGFENLDQAKNIIDSWVTVDEKGRITSIAYGTPPWFLARSAQIASYQTNVQRALRPGNMPVSLGRDVGTEEGVMNVPSDALVQIAKLMDISTYADSLKNVPGIKAGDSVYDRSLLIARILWAAIFVVNLVWLAYKTLIAGEEGDMVTAIFKGIFVLISLFFLREIIMMGIVLSSAVGNAILGGTDVAHAVSDISDIVNMKQTLVSTSGLITGMIAEGFITICGLIARAVVYVMFILADVMVAITSVIGPWMIVLSMLPFCESWASHWVKSYITFLFYRPLACLLCVVLYIVGLTGTDIGLIELMITCIVFVIAAVKVPSMAENMGGAATAVGAGMAGMVGRSLKTGAGVGARAAGMGAVVGASKALNAAKGKATPPRE